jgi:hypothetical protein
VKPAGLGDTSVVSRKVAVDQRTAGVAASQPLSVQLHDVKARQVTAPGRDSTDLPYPTALRPPRYSQRMSETIAFASPGTLTHLGFLPEPM